MQKLIYLSDPRDVYYAQDGKRITNNCYKHKKAPNNNGAFCVVGWL